MFNSIDTDKSGSIDYTEFLAASIEKSVYLKKEKLFQAFKLFDTTNEGIITSADFKKVLGCKPFYLTLLTFSVEDENYKSKPDKFWDKLIDESDISG